MAYIDNAYSADDSETQKLKELLVTHSLQVARKALEIAHTHALPLADGDIVAAAMLHDIGIIATNAPGIHCHGTEHYLRHGVLGAAMLRKAGAPEWLARVAERHTGTGITAKDIAEALEKQHGIVIDRRKLTLAENIKAFGTYLAEVKLYTDIAGKVKVVVSDK